MDTASTEVGGMNSAEDPLDSYSATVIRVAETVTPRVAAIEMTGNGRNGRFRVGAGSAVLFTSDGYLLTNAQNNLDTAGVIAGVVTYATLGIVTDAIVRLLEARLLTWRRGFAGS